MLRAIILRKFLDPTNGARQDGYETIDFESEELELVLTGGGYAEDGYDIRDVVGIEVLTISTAEQGQD